MRSRCCLSLPRVFGLAAALLLGGNGLGMDALREPAENDASIRPGVFPHEFVTDLATLAGDIAPSPSGRKVAYLVRRRTSDIDPSRNLANRFLPDGTPYGRAGSRVYLVDAEGGNGRVACEMGDTWAPSWAPDGRKLAFYSNAEGAVNVWIYSADSGSCRKVSRAAVKARHWQGDEPRWSADSRHVYVPLKPTAEQAPVDAEPKVVHAEDRPAVYAFRTDHELEEKGQGGSGGPEEYMAAFQRWENNADLARMDVASGATTIVVPHDAQLRPSVVRVSPSGQWLSYLSVFRTRTPNSAGTYDLAVVPASGGVPTVLFRDERVPERDYYRLSYQWDPKADRLVYLASGALWLVDLSSSTRKPRRLGESLGALADYPLAFTRDGRHVIVGIDGESNVTRALHGVQGRRLAAIPTDGGSPVVMPIDHERYRFERLLQASGNVAWQPEPGTITILTEDRAERFSTIIRFDLRTARQHVVWKGPPMRMQGAAADASHERLFVGHEEFSTPQQISAFDSRWARRALTSVTPELQSVETGSLHVFSTTVPTFDGKLQNVRTGVLLPPGRGPRDRVPAIVFVYPGADLVSAEAGKFAGGLGHFGLPVAVFTSRGYAVVYTHVPIGPGDQRGNAIGEIVDGLLPQVYKAAHLGYIDVERLALAGTSFGAFSTAAVLSRTTLFRAGVAANGAYDLAGTFYGAFQNVYSSDPGGMRWVEAGQPRIGGHPWEDPRRVIDNSPFWQADKIRTPLLILQGVDDFALPDAQRMYTALRRLGRRADLALYVGSGHVIRDWPRANAIDASKRMVSFVREHLGEP